MMRVAKALLLDANGFGLILRRSGTHPVHAYEADLPGGIIEADETFESGLAREIQEEAGITIDSSQLHLLGTRKGMGGYSKRLYVIHLDSRPAVTISWEHDQFKWVAPHDIPAALTGNDTFLQFAREHLTELY